MKKLFQIRPFSPAFVYSTYDSVISMCNDCSSYTVIVGLFFTTLIFSEIKLFTESFSSLIKMIDRKTVLMTSNLFHSGNTNFRKNPTFLAASTRYPRVSLDSTTTVVLPAYLYCSHELSVTMSVKTIGKIKGDKMLVFGG